MEQYKLDALKQLLEGLRNPNKKPEHYKAGEWQQAPGGSSSLSIELPADHFIFSAADMGANTLGNMLQESRGAYTLDKDDAGNKVAITITPAARGYLATALLKCIYRQEAQMDKSGRSIG